VSTLNQAIRIAAEAFDGSRDKGGKPYILHLLRVMMSVEGEKAQCVAILHDLLEDTPWTADMLRNKHFAPDIVEAVEALTKVDKEEYRDFCSRVARNDLALTVKLADLEDNMTITRLSALGDEDLERLRRYHDAYVELLASRGQQNGVAAVPWGGDKRPVQEGHL
jgi:(p)ppGpp synthase/HD superfamily hydrolase